MKNIEELHHQHTEITSEAAFLKKEIEFLLKLLRNAYSTSINTDKIKLLDAYWTGFEQHINKLDQLSEKIKKEEKSLAVLYKDGLIDYASEFREDSLLKEFSNINKAVKVLKESFYEYNHGCAACALKTSN